MKTTKRVNRLFVCSATEYNEAVWKPIIEKLIKDFLTVEGGKCELISMMPEAEITGSNKLIIKLETTDENNDQDCGLQFVIDPAQGICYLSNGANRVGETKTLGVK
jgi:hypothetical protein